MRKYLIITTVCLLLLGMVAALVNGADQAQTVEGAYMGLSRGPLRQAQLAALPKGVLLRSGKITISAKQLSAALAKTDAAVRKRLEQQPFVVLEELAVTPLLLIEAGKWAKETKRDTRKDTETGLIKAYLKSISEKVTVSDGELRAFYKENTEAFGGAPFEKVADEVKGYLLEEKQSAAVDGRIRTLSERIPVEVSAAWVKQYAAVMLDTPIDRARRSGKPMVAEFGREKCQACERMAPIIEELRTKYADQCTVLSVHTGKEPIISARYGIDTIPVQIFFDKHGKEVFRHVGFYPKAQMLARMAEIGCR